MTLHILEILRFKFPMDCIDPTDRVYTHVGYVMDPGRPWRIRRFKTKKAAAAYYDEEFGNEMRPLNVFGSWRSDWHPKTKLLYVVRDVSCFFVYDEEKRIREGRAQLTPRPAF